LLKQSIHFYGGISPRFWATDLIWGLNDASGQQLSSKKKVTAIGFHLVKIFRKFTN